MAFYRWSQSFIQIKDYICGEDAQCLDMDNRNPADIRVILHYGNKILERCRNHYQGVPDKYEKSYVEQNQRQPIE